MANRRKRRERIYAEKAAREAERFAERFGVTGSTAIWYEPWMDSIGMSDATYATYASRPEIQFTAESSAMVDEALGLRFEVKK